MLTPEDIQNLPAKELDKVSESLVQASCNTHLDTTETYGFVTKEGRDYYWNHDDDSEDSMQDYLDILK